MLQKIFFFVITSHDWFEHFGAALTPEKVVANSLVEIYSLWKDSKSKDFYWPGDHERTTGEIGSYFEDTSVTYHRQKRSDVMYEKSFHTSNDRERTYYEAAYYDALNYEACRGCRHTVTVRLHGFDGKVYAEEYRVIPYGEVWNWIIRNEKLAPDVEQDPYMDKVIDFYDYSGRKNLIENIIRANFSSDDILY